MLDRNHIGRTLPPAVLDIEKGRLRFFAKAIGETNPVYLVEEAALAAGYPALPAPPTFLFAAELDAGVLLPALVDMGVDLRHILHGEQQFTYLAPVCAGDTVTVVSTIADIYSKKGGALEFVVKDSMVTNQHGIHVASMRAVIVVRQGKPA